MKKLALVCVLAVSACGGDDSSDTKKTTTPKCTPTYQQCVGKDLQTCNAQGGWVTSETCTGTQECVVIAGTNYADCKAPVTPKEEFESCTGTGQGTCADGLACGPNLVFGGQNDKFCYTDCTAGASACDTDQYCDAGMFGENAYTEAPFCFPMAARNEFCLFNDEGCPAGMTCTSIAGGQGNNPECKLLCDGATVGTTGACTGGEECLAGPYVESEMNGDVAKTCTTDAECTTASLYKCIEVTLDSAGATAMQCARRIGICGTAAQIAPDFADQDVELEFLNSDSGDTMCNVLHDDFYCPMPVGGTATIECSSTGFAGRYDPAIECNGFDDYTSCMGFGECGTFDSTNYECMVSADICVYYCTSPDGLTEETCGGGLTCQDAITPIGRPAIEFNEAGAAVECADDGDCSTGLGFTCDSETFSDGSFCTMPRKICK